MGRTKILRVRRQRPIAGAQWTGVVTTIAMRALEQGLVEGVILTGTEPGTLNKPQPVLARTPEEVLACRGNKFGLSPTLEKIDDAIAAGLKRVMVVGTPCQFHALRVIEPTLPFDELWCLGILCSDNTTHENYMTFLKSVSRSPDTVVHMEFMPDFRLWMRHTNGEVEKLNFVEIPMHEIGPDLIAPSCRVCFNYTNSLADLSVGYMGGGMPDNQWLLIRNAKGWRLLDLIRDDVELSEPTESGSRALAMKGFLSQLGKPYTKGAPRPVKKTHCLSPASAGAAGAGVCPDPRRDEAGGRAVYGTPQGRPPGGAAGSALRLCPAGEVRPAGRNPAATAACQRETSTSFAGVGQDFENH